MSFSQRQGLLPASKVIQVSSMDTDLRNGLWNVMYRTYWSDSSAIYGYGTSWRGLIIERLWGEHFKYLVDDIPSRATSAVSRIREVFLGTTWNEAYDMLEAIYSYDQTTAMQTFSKACNQVLERENSAYRFIGGTISSIISPEEIKEVDKALSTGPIGGVRQHIQASLSLMSDRLNPDYRNSIKESISAVEAISVHLSGNPRATIKDALKALESNDQLHPALKDAFVKLYGYTSDEEGIRHKMLDESSLDSADATFMLVACSAFVNYLVAKSPGP